MIKFYKCELCGNLTYLLTEEKGKLVCCNQPMKLLKANSVDASTEKHKPFISKEEKNKVEVQVGSVEHPMLHEHHIQWMCFVQDQKVDFHHLKPNQKPHTSFCKKENKPYEIYEYCNLHGLWVTAK